MRKCVVQNNTKDGVKKQPPWCFCTLVHKYCNHLLNAVNLNLCRTHKMLDCVKLSSGNADVFSYL